MLFVDRAIKTKCCVDMAVPTQVIIHKNIMGEDINSVANSVAIQINCKLGGVPWIVNIPLKVCLHFF
jgi:aubergine-like protein